MQCTNAKIGAALPLFSSEKGPVSIRAHTQW